MLLGIDTGGTFTDFVLFDPAAPAHRRVRIHKVLSTPDAPERAILQGIAELGLEAGAAAGELAVIHGSTVATNAALENKGVKTVLVTNRGFKDLLSIGRQTRRELYELQPEPPQPPVAPELCLETGGRLGADGSLVEDLSEADLAAFREQLRSLAPEAVAINLLYSFLDNRFEKALAAAVPETMFCSSSHEVLAEQGEYERGIATWLNAYLGPRVANYLRNLKQALAPSPVGVMQSSGGTIAAEAAAHKAVNLLLSGPAGGLAAARSMGALSGSDRLLTFDMGGTSTDVALIDGQIKLTGEGRIGPYPVAVPMVDMHTIGAGGGSIAWLDSGGLLQVGPQSAGADPGPACYGKGALAPTVTDANLVLGRLQPSAFLGGAMQLDREAAERAVQRLATALGMPLIDTALGIVTLANEHMTRALRVISVQRGHDPADFRLCCFGGAGGLHVCALADALALREILIPLHGGVLSALGMLVAPRERQLSQALRQPLTADCAPAVDAVLAQLRRRGTRELQDEGIAATQISAQASVDLCYRGQSFPLNVPWDNPAQARAAFEQRHEQRYGHRLARPVELVNARLACRAPGADLRLPHLPAREPATAAQRCQLPGIAGAVAIYRRETIAPGQLIDGPALITERIATSLVAEGWQARCDSHGNLLLQKRYPTAPQPAL